MKVEHRLPCARADVDDHAVVVEPFCSRDGGHESQHPAGFLVGELVDLTKRVDMPLGQYEQVRFRGRRDVPDRYEAIGGVDMP